MDYLNLNHDPIEQDMLLLNSDLCGDYILEQYNSIDDIDMDVILNGFSSENFLTEDEIKNQFYGIENENNFTDGTNTQNFEQTSINEYPTINLEDLYNICIENSTENDLEIKKLYLNFEENQNKLYSEIQCSNSYFENVSNDLQVTNVNTNQTQIEEKIIPTQNVTITIIPLSKDVLSNQLYLNEENCENILKFVQDYQEKISKSNSNIETNDKEKLSSQEEIELKKNHLKSILHAANCLRKEPNDDYKCKKLIKCKIYRKLYKHIEKKCKNKFCKIKNCYASRQLMTHLFSCEDINCVLECSSYIQKNAK